MRKTKVNKVFSMRKSIKVSCGHRRYSGNCILNVWFLTDIESRVLELRHIWSFSRGADVILTYSLSHGWS